VSVLTRTVSGMADLTAAWTEQRTDNIPTVGGSVPFTKPVGMVHAAQPVSNVTLCGQPVVQPEPGTPWSLVMNSPQACPICASLADERD
jgi:hypothetical protein